MSNYSYYVSEPNYAHGSPEATGVLLVNLGTPEAPTPRALRRYLAEFLGDPRVIELPRLQWRLILHGIVLRTRPQRVAKSYAGIWEEQGSPLLNISRRQAASLEAKINERTPGPVHVALGMSYGNPSITDALAELRHKGARRVILLPMYPQYSGSTSASVFEATANELNRWRWIPEFRWIQHYADDPGYIDSLARSVEEHWSEHGRGEMLLMSFHGVPRRYLLNGDPYHCLCQKTGRLVAERLGLDEGGYRITFQSRFGREPWLQPYTDETVQALGEQGLGRLDVICPGFPADCLETLEEIGGENREIFEEAGGGELHYIAALNDRDDHMDALTELVLRHTQGWPETDERMRQPTADELKASRERALALGAEQ